MFNAKLADDVLAQIDNDLDSWHQAAWAAPVDKNGYETMWHAMEGDLPGSAHEHREPVTACGAKLCFAGHAAVMSGWMMTRDVFRTAHVVNPANGHVEEIMDAAANELGIAPETVLFEGVNNREELGQIVDAYRNGGDESDATHAIGRYYNEDSDYYDEQDI